jgi:glycosyltransferase involved in cell wall biosynthesis
VLVFEPDPAGHHFPFLALMLPAVSALASETILMTGANAPATESYRYLIKPLEGRITVEPSMPATSDRPSELSRARAAHILASIQRHRADHLIVMYADGIAQALTLRRWSGRPSLPRGITSEGLFFRGSFAYPISGLKRRLATTAAGLLLRAAPFTHMHHLDPLVYERLRSPRWSLMPDPVERPDAIPVQEARRRLGIPQDGRVLGCVGTIDRRKGVDLLLEAFARAALAPTDRLLLLGVQDEAVRAALTGPHAPLVRAGRIIAMDRFVSPEEFASGVLAMDLVCTPYPAHIGSASIVIRAAAAGRPVLGSTFGWVGRTIPMFALGRTCQVTDIPSFADNIRSSLDEAQGWKPNAAAERFVRFHSPENFARAWCVGLRRRLGLPPEPGALTWEWVRAALDRPGT